MKRVMTTLTTVFFTTSAFAWSANVQGPDVFGATTVVAVEDGTQTSLVIQCSTEGDLFFAMISPKKEFEEVTTAPATLYFATGNNSPIKIEANLREWNDKHYGVVSNVEEAEIMPLIEGVRDAKGSIKVGAEIRGNRISDIYSSRGSTTAMKKVIDNCKLGNR